MSGDVLLSGRAEEVCQTGLPACPILKGQTRMVCPTVGTYVNGRRLPLQGRGWGFESLRAYQKRGRTGIPACPRFEMRSRSSVG